MHIMLHNLEKKKNYPLKNIKEKIEYIHHLGMEKAFYSPDTEARYHNESSGREDQTMASNAISQVRTDDK